MLNGLTPYYSDSDGAIGVKSFRKKSPETRKKMSGAAKKVWQTKRQKARIGEERLINDKIKVRTKSKNGWIYWKNKPVQEKTEYTIKEAFELTSQTRSRLRAKGIKIPKLNGIRRKGCKFTKEHREKISKANRKYLFDVRAMGSIEKARIRKSAAYKNWRTSVFERDGYTCIKCGKVGGYLQAHHIKSFTKYPDLRFETDNGATVCVPCHKKINRKQMRGNKNGRKKHN